jgi:hypothetical protein
VHTLLLLGQRGFGQQRHVVDWQRIDLELIGQGLNAAAVQAPLSTSLPPSSTQQGTKPRTSKAKFIGKKKTCFFWVTFSNGVL